VIFYFWYQLSDVDLLFLFSHPPQIRRLTTGYNHFGSSFFIAEISLLC
jgi:hypothetical protein